MKEEHKPAEIREKELRLAINTIQRGRAQTKATKLSIAAVAREAGVSAALIHNHYPSIAEAIRNAQGHDSRAQRDAKHKALNRMKEVNRELRGEIESLRKKVATLASINEVLVSEVQVLKAKFNNPIVIDLDFRKNH
jgi:AcrR family transcriptional regulator